MSGAGSTESPKSEGAGFAAAGAGRQTEGGTNVDAVDETEETHAVEPVDELAEARRERDEYLDALQRLKAEFDNYRKRVARDQQEVAARAHERLVKELVPILDDLERALAHDPRSGSGIPADADEGDLDEGIRLIHRQFSDALAKEGLTEIPTEGKFDPHTQEALLSQPSEVEEGTVIDVLQKGYRLGDRVLRPARVVISAGANG